MTDITKPSKTELAKNAAGFVLRRSVSTTVTAVVVQNVTTETRLQRVQLGIGAFLLADMAAKQAWNHVKQEVVELKQQIIDARAQAEAAKDNPDQ